jgi:hypothetical protein
VADDGDGSGAPFAGPPRWLHHATFFRAAALEAKGVE